jgi:glycosyltransferase involved in cell wall biosynthesis
MKTQKPLVSVVMPVYNAFPFLQASIESMLSQTFGDFEFIILNDGSTDASSDLLREWERKDARIHVYDSTQRLGLAESGNVVISKAQGELIARMDADDLSEPNRLERQLETMNHNADVVLVGTLSDGIDEQGREVRGRDRWRIVRRSIFPPFPHGSVMFRRVDFDAVGGYRPGTEGYEDRDLFRRLAERGRVVTLPEVLYHYRYHSLSASVSTVFQSQSISSWYSLGALRLWAGHRPKILRGIWQEKSENWSLRRLLVLLWAAWADLSPASLRSFLRTVVRSRDLLASSRIIDGRVYEWRFK